MNGDTAAGRRVGKRARKSRQQAKPPLTELQQAILALLTDQPQRQADLARKADCQPGTVAAVLRALRARDLVQQDGYGGGWFK
jgi:DNA-binding MarR family transcriptional regulator